MPRGDISAWRAWAEHAQPELRELFNAKSRDCMKAVRRRYPVDCGPGHHRYQDMRLDTISALNELACQLQEKQNAFD